MFGSMFVGLSGMNAYSSGLRQISNNITNLNSLGFKGSTTQFGDLVRVGTGMGSGSRDGQGVALRESRTDFAQGELRQTSRGLDLAVDGAGFITLLRPDGQAVLVRTGSFEVDRDGHLVLAGTDLRLSVMNGSGQPTAISLAGQRFSAPQATTKVKFTGNLSSTATTANHTVPVTVFDSTGDSQGWQVTFTRDPASVTTTPPAVEWTVEVRNAAGTSIGSQRIRFESGSVTAATSKPVFTDPLTGLAIEFDFSEGVTPFSNGDRSDLNVAQNGRDGRDRGDLVNVSINEKGEVLLTYSNQDTKTVGEVALAMPADAQDLQEVGSGQYQLDDLRGVAFVGSGSKGAGRVLSNRLEASNVDLSRQFGELILIQRGYQASSQIVSVSNEMIQQLFAIRGQG